jgi:hypothetical protein
MESCDIPLIRALFGYTPTHQTWQDWRMPITAKFSRKFYETLGEDVANELVDWFNKVDATYRSDLREVNEANFRQFEAKLEQRLTELDAKWTERFALMDARFVASDAKLEQRLAELKSELVRWMFAFWAPTAIAVVAILLRG